MYYLFTKSTMDNHIFQMKMAVKELSNLSKKCDKDAKAEKSKCVASIRKGQQEVARIHAENVIRQERQSLNYIRMSARVDAMVGRLQSATITRKLTGSVAGVVRGLDMALKTMNLEKVSNLIDKFEKQSENFDIQTSTVENTICMATAKDLPQSEVDTLMKSIAEEAGIELKMELPAGETSTFPTVPASTQGQTDEDELAARLAQLRTK